MSQPIFIPQEAFAAAVERMLIAARMATDPDGLRVFVRPKMSGMAVACRQALAEATGHPVEVVGWDEMMSPPLRHGSVNSDRNAIAGLIR